MDNKDLRDAFIAGALYRVGGRPMDFTTETIRHEALKRYPNPPRALPDPHDRDVRWRVKDGDLECSPWGDGTERLWQPMKGFTATTFIPTPGRVRLWYDLLANPNE